MAAFDRARPGPAGNQSLFLSTNNRGASMEEDEYIGEIRLFAGDYAPQGWLLCDGRAYPTSGHEALYSLIGEAWGSPAPNTFCVPDLRDRVPIGQGQGPGLSPRALGKHGGSPSELADLPPHTHKFRASKADAGDVPVEANILGKVTANGSVTGLYLKVGGTAVALNSKSIEYAGGSVPHDNYMPSFAVNYIICEYGVYPDLD